MIGRAALAGALALAAATAPMPPAAPAASAERPATLADRLRWNAWERTRTGLGRLERGEPAPAAEAFDAALRLRPDDPLASYNAGTGRLAAGRADAVAALEAAASSAPPALAPDAWYNLGNARLAAGDARGAAAAYVETLRRASDRLEAKKNLELALRALERQRPQPDAGAPPPAGGEAQPGGSGSGSDGEGSARPGEDGEDAGGSAASDDARGREPGAGAERAQDSAASEPDDRAGRPGAAGAPEAAPGGRQRGLRDFRDQPDLDAEQAAALLAAVENLERQQRRARALERARARGRAEKDW